MTRIGIIGGEGRMGRAIAAALAEAGEAPATTIGRGGDPAALARACDVLVDFSAPDALEANLDAAIAAGVPILVGTTGLAERHLFLVEHAGDHVAVLQTGNTSLGITLLAHLVGEAAARLGEDWDIEIVETHHRRKLDAPSGTALLLGQAAAQGRGITLEHASPLERARADGAIGFASLRGGTVAGDHSVLFLGPGERLVLAHMAESRAIFAQGALRAARWLIGRAAGCYTMAQVLGL